MLKRFHLLVALLLAISLAAAACGSDDTEDVETDTTEESDAGAEDTADDADADADGADDEEMADEDAAAETDGESLLIWADENRVEPLQAIAPAFTEETGVEVQVELVPFDEIRDQVTQAGPAGEGPDIFVGAHDWTGEQSANGIIEPIDLSAVESNIVPVGLDGFNFAGETYALPYAIEAIAMYRNTDLVPDAPATWDEAVAACDAASVENCFVLPGGGNATDAYHQYPFVSAFDGYLFAFDPATGFDPSDVGLDNPESIQGVQTLAAQVEAGYVASTDYDTAKNLFLDGSAAFWITGPWELGAVQDQDTVNWEVSLIPEIGDGPVESFVGAQGFYLSAFSENKLVANSFLVDFLATDELMQALYDADPRPSAWIPLQESLADNPEVTVFTEAASNGIPIPNIPEMAAVWGPLGDNLLLVRNGEQDGEAAMTTAAEAIRGAVSG